MSLFDLKYIFRTIAGWGKKIFIVVFVYALVVSLFIHFIAKDKAPLNQNQPNAYVKNKTELYRLVNNPELKKTKEGKARITALKSTACWLIGETCTDNPNDAAKYFPKSFSGKLAGLIALPLLNPPASGVYWASTTLQEAGFVPKSYAAEGIGFSSLRPIMNLWRVFRDFAYLLLVIVLIAIGFMIMFRMKLNPQTVISVENALPKIVVAMLLITFSFAIAGFLIDLMYVFIAVLVAVISNNGAFYDIGKMQNTYLNGNGTSLWESVFNNPANLNLNDPLELSGRTGPFDVFNRAATTVSGWLYLNYLGKAVIGNLLSALPDLISGTILLVVNTTIGFLVTNFLFMFIHFFISSAPENLAAVTIDVGGIPKWLTVPLVLGLSAAVGFQIGPSIIIPIIAGALIFFTILFLFFRIFFLLFKAYLQILFMTIIGPFLLLFEAVPGKSSFSTWFKHLAADIFTFPIVIAVLSIGYVLANQVAVAGDFWRPPFLNVIDPSLIPVFIGGGVLFMTPDLVKLAKEQLFGIKELPLSFGFGTFFGGAGVATGGTMGLLGQISTASMGLSALTGKSIHQIFSKEQPSGQNNTAPASGAGKIEVTGSKPGQ